MILDACRIQEKISTNEHLRRSYDDLVAIYFMQPLANKNDKVYNIHDIVAMCDAIITTSPVIASMVGYVARAETGVYSVSREQPLLTGNASM